MSSEDVTEMLMQCILSLQQRDYKEALALANQILEKEPGNKTVIQIRELLPRSITKQQAEYQKEQEEELKELEEDKNENKEESEEGSENEEGDSEEDSESSNYHYEDHPSSDEESEEESEDLKTECTETTNAQ